MARDPACFSIGQYFLRQYPGSTRWYAAWFDAASKQTKRVTLATSDFEVAKREFARLVTVHGDLREAKPETITLAQAFARYEHHHEDQAGGLASARDQKRHRRFWLDFYGERATAADINTARQHAFVAHLKRVEHAKGRGYEPGYIKRIFASGFAALHWCRDRGEIESVPRTIDLDDSQPRERVLDNDEIRALWDAIQAPGLLELRRYSIVLLNTGCRPEAARDLTAFQVDLSRNRLNLNTPGRHRTAKGRPLIPITATLRPWLVVDGRERVIGRGEKWLSIQWRAARDRAGLGTDVVPYVLRHTVATVLDERAVAENEIVAFMGWKFSNRMRGWYTKRREYRPDYCASVVAALDGWMADLGLQSETARVGARAVSDPVNLALRGSRLQAKVATGGQTLENPGAGEGIRTLDPNLGKVVLYP